MSPSTPRVCKAKNPATCRVHGVLPGVSAYSAIEHIMSLPQNDFSALLVDSRVEKINTFPLKKLSPTGLSLVLLQNCDTLNVNTEKIKESLILAAELHQEDVRSQRGPHHRTAYIEHPLRNTIRAIRCGVEDEATLIGSLLHDTVEDHPYELSKKNNVETDVETVARAEAFKYIENRFGKEVKEMVEGMSNPIIKDKYTPAVIKNKVYADHVKEAINQPRVFVGKACDFIDNAVGLYHNVNSMEPKSIYKKALKYSPVADIFLEHIKILKTHNNNPIISYEGLTVIEDQITVGKKSLARLLKTYQPA